METVSTPTSSTVEYSHFEAMLLLQGPALGGPISVLEGALESAELPLSRIAVRNIRELRFVPVEANAGIIIITTTTSPFRLGRGQYVTAGYTGPFQVVHGFAVKDGEITGVAQTSNPDRISDYAQIRTVELGLRGLLNGDSVSAEDIIVNHISTSGQQNSVARLVRRLEQGPGPLFRFRSYLLRKVGDLLARFRTSGEAEAVGTDLV